MLVGRRYLYCRHLMSTMRNPTVAWPIAFITVGFILLGGLGAAGTSSAGDTTAELVPEPWVHETHEYNVTGEIDGEPTDEFFVNEKWSIEVQHGDVTTLIMARNITQSGEATVDYTNNIHYEVDGKLYIAQFMIMGLEFQIGGYGVSCPLTTCSDFELSYTPIVYDGEVPTLDCNITYHDIEVYPAGTFPVPLGESTVDLSLVHHIRADWNNTKVKIDAILDFADTVFFNPDEGYDEFPVGQPFNAIIRYGMMLANPEDLRTSGPLVPSEVTDSTLIYNLTTDSGTPLTMSRLDMNDDFTIYNATAATPATGYSQMEAGGGTAQVTHGFPNITYGDSTLIVSDPEITICHDTVAADSGTAVADRIMIAAAGAVAAAVVVAGVLLLRKKKGH